MRPFTRRSLGFVTAATMAVATFPVVVVSVLAADLIVEFDIERWQFGALVTGMGVTGGLLSPGLGRLTDRMGAVKSMIGVLGLGLLTFGLIAATPAYVFLVVAAVLTGVTQGWCNPATNALIVGHVKAGARGVITGIKQSGVQMGTFSGGLLLPVLAGWWGWRNAVFACLVLPALGLIGMWSRDDPRGGPIAATTHPRGVVPVAVKWIAAYGVLTGVASSAIFTFLPLFADEDQAWSSTQAGLLLAGVGFVGVVARISWGPVSERWLGHGRALRLIAVQSMTSATLLALAAQGSLPSWVLVPAALLFGAGAISWNTVGMLGVMDYSPAGLVGRGTGLVLLGFLFGYGMGAPIMGLSIDRLGSYMPGWIAVAVLFAGSAMVAGRIHRTGILLQV